MRKILTIIIAMCIWGCSLLAQNNLTKPYDMNNGSTIISEKDSNNLFMGIDFSERVITTAIIIGEIVLLLGLIIYWKQSKGKSRPENKKLYKNNIRAIRDERIKPKADLKITDKRRTLKNKIALSKLNGKTITSTAKKMAISKGELLLAAKIKQLQSQVK